MTTDTPASYSPEILRIPRLEVASLHYDSHILNIRNHPTDDAHLRKLFNESSVPGKIVISENAANNYFSINGYSRRNFTFTIGKLALFSAGIHQILLGRQMPCGSWHIYPAILEFTRKFRSIRSEARFSIGHEKHAGRSMETVLRKKDAQGNSTTSFHDPDLMRQRFGDHFASEIRNLSYLFDAMDTESACPPILAHWDWKDLSTPEMTADLQLLSNYMNRLLPEAETYLKMMPPNALQNGKSIWPSLTFRVERSPISGPHRNLIRDASKWVNRLFHENHLAVRASDLCVFRKMKAGGESIKAPEFWSSGPASNHQALHCQARFGPLPDLTL